MCNLYNWEECDCACHTDSEEDHGYVCCNTCDTCGKKISTMYWDMHQQRHAEESGQGEKQHGGKQRG